MVEGWAGGGGKGFAGAVHATACPCVTQRDSCPPQSGRAFCVHCERPVERCLLDGGCGESAAVIPPAVAFFDNDDSWLTSPRPSTCVSALQFGAGIVFLPNEKKKQKNGQTRIQAPKKVCETSAPACLTPTLRGSSLRAWGVGGFRSFACLSYLSS